MLAQLDIEDSKAMLRKAVLASMTAKLLGGRLMKGDELEQYKKKCQFKSRTRSDASDVSEGADTTDASSVKLLDS